MNNKGAGVFICVNATDFLGRGSKNITRIRAFFSDDDSGSGKVIQPNTFEIQSSSGPHSYMVLNEIVPTECFKTIQKRIAERLGTDTAINDLGRVMRLTGTLHLKNPESPFLVKIKSAEGKKFSLSEVENFFPGKDQSSTVTKLVSNSPDKNFDSFVSKLPFKEGGRNSSVVNLVTEGLGRGIAKKKLEQFVADYCIKSSLDLPEGLEILEHLSIQHETTPFTNETSWS